MKKSQNKEFFYLNKKAQVSIFIIVAMLIVGLAVLFYSFYPQIKSSFAPESDNPQAFLQNCLEDEMQNAVDEVSIHGGAINPDSFYMYKGEKIRYLCYTNEYYKLCTVQEPLLIQSIESEIQKELTQTASDCFDDLKKAFQRKGYQVTLTQGSEEIKIVPKKVVYSFNRTLTLTKEEPKIIKNFKVVLNRNFYDLLSNADNIVSNEAAIGNIETTTYMNYYPNLKVEKLTQEDGTKIYILTNRLDGTKFQFATRSLAWPPGYSNE